jgi:hypothetical protein
MHATRTFGRPARPIAASAGFLVRVNNQIQRGLAHSRKEMLLPSVLINGDLKAGATHGKVGRLGSVRHPCTAPASSSLTSRLPSGRGCTSAGRQQTCSFCANPVISGSYDNTLLPSAAWSSRHSRIFSISSQAVFCDVDRTSVTGRKLFALVEAHAQRSLVHAELQHWRRVIRAAFALAEFRIKRVALMATESRNARSVA